MAKLDRFTDDLWDLDTFHLFDDFENDVTSTRWTATATDSGGAAVGDERGGVVTLTPSDGTVADNDEIYYATANELFLFAADCALYARFRAKFAEVSAGVPNIAFGFMNAATANSIIDDGGGVKVSGSTMAIYKVDGETVWRLATANNSVSTVTKSSNPATAGVWHDIVIEAVEGALGNMTVSAMVNGMPLLDPATNLKIRHEVAIASATEMQLFFGIKLGGATNNDTLKVDFAYGAQRRVLPVQ